MFAQVPGHPNHVAMARRNLARSLLELGRLDEAAVELDVAASLAKRDSEQASILLLRGELARRLGRLEEARRAQTLAVSRTETTEPARRLEPLIALAETDLALERFGDAAVEAERAVGVARAVYGDRSCRLAEPLRLRAEALVSSGNKAEALPLAERALALSAEAQIDPVARARVEHTLARAKE
jgi:tetratricopeptide (TPR) repeat protein